MSDVVEFENFADWHKEVGERGLSTDCQLGVGEDPYIHWFAVDITDTRFGYFGDAGGADVSYGFIADTGRAYQRMMK